MSRWHMAYEPVALKEFLHKATGYRDKDQARAAYEMINYLEGDEIDSRIINTHLWRLGVSYALNWGTGGQVQHVEMSEVFIPEKAKKPDEQPKSEKPRADRARKEAVR